MFRSSHLTAKLETAQSKKFLPRVALVGLGDEEEKLISECCKQFGIAALSVSENRATRFQREKFEGVVVAIDEAAPELLSEIRNSRSNQRVLIYALCDRLRDVMPLARFGINASFERPLERQAVLKVLRGTRLLILNEFRRYLRVPIVLPVRIETDSGNINASSCELSGGGTSLIMPQGKLHVGDRVAVSFTLPDSPVSKMPAQVCWRKDAEKMIGLRFDESAPGRMYVKKWIDEFLGIK